MIDRWSAKSRPQPFCTVMLVTGPVRNADEYGVTTTS
jgi:hypothetical protein